MSADNLTRLDRLEALIAAPPADGGPAHRIASDSQYAVKSKGGGRKVASEAGVKRYGLPIGTPLGQGKAKNEQDAYDRFMSLGTPAELTKAAQWMSNGDLALTAKAVFSVVSLNERNTAAQLALVRELAQRGLDPHDFGYKGGYVPLNPKPKKDPTLGTPEKIDRVSVDAEKVSDADLDVLMKAGWKGEQGDQKEALYAPENPTPIPQGSLSPDAVDMLLKQGWTLGSDGQLQPKKTRIAKEQDRLAKAEKTALDKAVREAQTAEKKRQAEAARAAYMAQGLAAEFAKLDRRS